MKIESVQNQKVKNWFKLKEKKYRDEKQEFLIEGAHLVEEAKKHGAIKELITLEDQEENFPSYTVTKEIMKKLSSQVTPPTCMAVCFKKEETPIGDNVMILDNIQDPGNLGTIIRSAVAFSYDTIILSEDCVDLYNEKVIRSTKGMLFSVNILRRNLDEELKKLKEKHYTIYGTDVHEGNTLNTITFQEKKAIIIGNEGKGMNPSFYHFVDDFIYIPMSEKCESLNAAISASIIMYESRCKH